MKEINLLPEHIAFDYRFYVIKRVAIFLVVFNIIWLFAFYFVGSYFNGFLENKLKERTVYLHNIKRLNGEFNRYRKQYVAMKKKYRRLQEEIAYYKKLKVIHRSAFADSVVFINSFRKGVAFSSVSYKDGHFDITGLAASRKTFQLFYKELDDNPYVFDLKFYYLKRNKNGNTYMFKISYAVEFKW